VGKELKSLFLHQRLRAQLGGDPGCEMQQEFGVDDCAVARNVYSYGGSALAQVGGCRPVTPCS
jgi:hypothetical protein